MRRKMLQEETIQLADRVFETPSPLTVIAAKPRLIQSGHLRIGSALSPQRQKISVDSRSLTLDGVPWLPVMGEFHYSRYPRAEWRESLLRMKLGGIDIVATYVFWIHHEEIEGVFDWCGRRDLREFLTLCGDVGLRAVIRCGPWCHGECRNGGLPDWLVAKDLATRSDDPEYLRYVRSFYEETAEQLGGLLWKDGGPVIGIQCENEFPGPAEHLLTLKRMARDAGIDVPLYTRTGWPELSTPMPHGEMLPLFGGYPDGFWDRSLDEMPPGYNENFLFRLVRNDATVATDQLGVREAVDSEQTNFYPYFACEIGGGMMTSYHRRIRIAPQDIESLALAKIGSGNNLQGYYMYHGGVNPKGRLTTLQESQATGYWNDLPAKTYDFQAPLGEFGQVRPHYHGLRRLHLFLRDWGAQLAEMPAYLPEVKPSGGDDTKTLRWSIRTDGRSGFVFVNNYQRLRRLPPKRGVQFDIRLPAGDLHFPIDPISVPSGTSFMLPFNLDLGGVNLIYATAQPICRLDDSGTTYAIFGEIEGVAPEFVFDRSPDSLSTTGTASLTGGRLRIHHVCPGRGAAVDLRTPEGERLIIILLDPDDSRACWKAELGGLDRIFLTRAALTIDGSSVRLSSSDRGDLAVSVLPCPETPTKNRDPLDAQQDGLFTRFELDIPAFAAMPVSFEKIVDAGPAREVKTGSQGVAEAPVDADFEAAAVWRIDLPVGADPSRNARLSVEYAGDVARVYLGNELITDNFYNGAPLEIGLKRYGSRAYGEDLLVKILPLRCGASIYLPDAAWPVFGSEVAAGYLENVEIIDDYDVELEFDVPSHQPEMVAGSEEGNER